MKTLSTTKRQLVRIGAIVGAGCLANVFAPSVILRPVLAQEKKEQEEKVTHPEDLMREHGVLNRVLLIYEAAIHKLSRNEDFDPGVVTQSAGIIRDFINNYHEKSEEEHVFPRFKSAGKMVDLVDTLLQQHQAGRRVTEKILNLAPTSRRDADQRSQIVAVIQSFITMYRPHAAREDTDLFPELQKLVSPNEYDAMAEEFEKKEHQLFGADGFEKVVQQVAKIEETIGIHNLNQFTPKV
jgi:hemerythrin-like domain-containing protein